MNRRNFFKVAGATAVVTSLPLALHAADSGNHVMIDSEIANNHGHGLSLSIVDVTELFALTNDGSSQTIDIQGQSGHPHSVELTQEDLVTLMGSQELIVESSTVSGHSHTVTVSLEIVEV